jgi:large subunit ribosomal protein L23
MYKGLLRPIVTEKGAASGALVVEVDRKMNKCDIRKAFEAVFNVKVKSVRTINQKGKVKGSFGKVGQRRDIKKAYISLIEGQDVEFIRGL